MNVIVEIKSEDRHGKETVKKTLTKESRDTDAQKRVFNYFKDNTTVLGLAYSLRGNGLIEFKADASQMTPAVINAITKTVEEAFDSI